MTSAPFVVRDDVSTGREVREYPVEAVGILELEFVYGNGAEVELGKSDLRLDNVPDVPTRDVELELRTEVEDVEGVEMLEAVSDDRLVLPDVNELVSAVEVVEAETLLELDTLVEDVLEIDDEDVEDTLQPPLIDGTASGPDVIATKFVPQLAALASRRF